jgi:hypothetical protein
VPSTPTDGHDIVVLGASAGGLDALKELLASLPAGLRASMFLVLHLSASWPSQIAEILSKSSSLPCRFGQDGDLIEHGTLLIAPPDRHLIVKREHVRLSPGPRENFWRPSIDVLFRSAAVAHGSRVVGVTARRPSMRRGRHRAGSGSGGVSGDAEVSARQRGRSARPAARGNWSRDRPAGARAPGSIAAHAQRIPSRGARGRSRGRSHAAPT